MNLPSLNNINMAGNLYGCLSYFYYIHCAPNSKIFVDISKKAKSYVFYYSCWFVVLKKFLILIWLGQGVKVDICPVGENK